MKKNAIELLGIGGAVFGAMLMQGCNTVYSNRANSEDLSLRPQPEMLTPVSVGDVTPVAPVEEEVPYWQQAKADESEATAPAVGFTDYVVKKGDTLSGIAARYGLRWQDVAAVNPGLDPNKVVVGKTIKLPGTIDLGKAVAAKTTSSGASAKATAASGSYVVKNGDILGRIANAHGVKLSDLMKANGLADANKIRVGQKLVIPGASKAAAKSKAEKAPVNVGQAPQKEAAVQPVQQPQVIEVVPPVIAPEETVPPAEVDFTPPQIDTTVTAPAIPSTEEVIPAPEQMVVAEEAAAVSFQTITTNGEDDLLAIASKWGAMPGEITALNPQLAQYTNSIPPAGIEVKIPLPSVK